MRGQIPSIPSLFFYRHQIPLTLGFAFTDYKSQGSTFVSLILDLLFGKQRGVDQHGALDQVARRGQLRVEQGQ